MDVTPTSSEGITIPLRVSPSLSGCHPPSQDIPLPLRISSSFSHSHPLSLMVLPSLSLHHPPSQGITLPLRVSPQFLGCNYPYQGIIPPFKVSPSLTGVTNPLRASSPHSWPEGVTLTHPHPLSHGIIFPLWVSIPHSRCHPPPSPSW